MQKPAPATSLPAALVIGAVLAVAWTPVAAQQAAPSAADTAAGMKALMERAQDAERRAVEDLVNKLQKRPSEAATPAPAAAVPPSPPAPPSLPAVAPVATPPAPPAPPASPAVDAAKPADAAVAPPAAVALPFQSPPPPPAAPAQPAAVTPAIVPPAPAVPSTTPTSTATPVAPSAAPVAAEPPKLASPLAQPDGRLRPYIDLEIYFEFASAAISPRSNASLTTLGRSLADPRLADQKFLIAGYTDGKGKADYNLRLSQQRADAVRQFLTTAHGIDERRLIAKGYGKGYLKDPRNPIADANRRVQIINWTN